MTAAQHSAPHPLRTIAVILYVTLGMLWLAIPQSVTNWTRDFLPYAMQPYAGQVAQGFESFARATGVPAIYEALHDSFQRAAGKKP